MLATASSLCTTREKSARGRLTYSWTLRGELDGTIASGALRITGVHRFRGRRLSCNHKPSRTFTARVAGAAPLVVVQESVRAVAPAAVSNGAGLGIIRRTP